MDLVSVCQSSGHTFSFTALTLADDTDDISDPFQVMNGAVLQQVFVVEFTVNNHMCDDCHRVEAKDFWRALVQIRQKVPYSIFQYTNLFYYFVLFSDHDDAIWTDKVRCH